MLRLCCGSMWGHMDGRFVTRLDLGGRTLQPDPEPLLEWTSRIYENLQKDLESVPKLQGLGFTV